MKKKQRRRGKPEEFYEAKSREMGSEHDVLNMMYGIQQLVEAHPQILECTLGSVIACVGRQMCDMPDGGEQQVKISLAHLPQVPMKILIRDDDRHHYDNDPRFVVKDNT